MSDRAYFQLEQARGVARVFSVHNVEYLFIRKGGAIILGYPAATQDVDIFPKRDPENGRNIVAALRELDFEIEPETAEKIVSGADFVQLKNGPFDLDLVFAPDGIESFEVARKRMHMYDGFPVANFRDIIASKRESGREKDLVDLPLLEDFQDEFERYMRGEPQSAIDIAMDRTKDSIDD